ncbi:MAG: sugar ABC transporter permease [Ilumatobacteraceae bacterium]|nr:sugar ABC transporter permease [Ilumatobacteraceae bacterium]
MSTDVTTAPRKGRRRRYSQLSRRDKIALSLFAGVPTVIHIVFVWIPAISTIVLSFTNWDGLKLGTWKLTGFSNYWAVFTVFDNRFFPAFFNNLILLVFLSICSAIGVLFAYLLDKNIRGSAIYQSVFYMPVVLSLAVVGFIWKGVMWSPRQGMFNVILGRTAQGDQIDWVGNAQKIFTFRVPGLDTPIGLSKNFAALLIALAWRHIGYVMVLYLAGLKSVDPSLREAAAIDGCNEWQSFRRVVFPVMKPINVVVFVITVIEALRAFDIIFALKKPPGTEVLGILVRDNLVGEGGGHVGLGSSYGVILLMLCLGFIIWYLVNNYRENEA